MRLPRGAPAVRHARSASAGRRSPCASASRARAPEIVSASDDCGGGAAGTRRSVRIARGDAGRTSSASPWNDSRPRSRKSLQTRSMPERARSPPASTAARAGQRPALPGGLDCSRIAICRARRFERRTSARVSPGCAIIMSPGHHRFTARGVRADLDEGRTLPVSGCSDSPAELSIRLTRPAAISATGAGGPMIRSRERPRHRPPR